MSSSTKENTKKTFAGYRLLGLGFWQAWWMVSLCTNAILPNEYHYPFAGNTTLWVLTFSTLGYLLVVATSKQLSPFNGRRSSFFIAGSFTAAGSLLLPYSLISLDGPIGFSVFLFATVLVSLGNAVLLIMWGELWSSLATGRVGRHLYFSYSFAFILFFIGYFLPSPLNVIFVAILPIISASVLYSCKNEPRRSATIIPLNKKTIPVVSIFLCVFAISVIHGFVQGIIGGFAGTGDEGIFVVEGFFVAGIGIAAIALSMVIAPAEVESVALYRPVIPAMTAGIIALLILQPPYGFVGMGLTIMGIYCLDMLIMLTSTDIAYRARISVAQSFGLSILVTRTGTLVGSFTAHNITPSIFWSEMLRADLLLIGVLVLIFIGMVFFTQSDMQKFYHSPTTVDSNHASLQERCDSIARMCDLTNREREVLELLARGKTVKGVCEKLNIAQGTAKHHVSSIYRKVGVFDRQSLHSVVEQGAVGKDAWE